MRVAGTLGRFCKRIRLGSVVQWIEYQIPVLTIWVRIPSGSRIHRKFRLSITRGGTFLLSVVRGQLVDRANLRFGRANEDWAVGSFEDA